MTELLLIADDLTGALDCAVALVSAGVEVYPLAGVGPTVAELVAGPAVVAVNAATRHMAPAEAAEVVGGLVRRAREAGVRVIIKKTDSALRGNVGAELAAAQAEAQGMLHFVPAYPAMHRVTVDGIHLVDGSPVGESPFGRDPFEPVGESLVRDLIARQSSVATCPVPRGGHAPASFEGIVVYDAAEQADLDELAERLLAGGPVVLAGCAGISCAVAKAMGCASVGTETLRPGNVLALCGSVNAASVAQCHRAEREGVPAWAVDEQAKKRPDWPESADFEAIVREAAASWDACPLTVVDASAYTPAADGSLPAPAVRERISANLGLLAATIAGESSAQGWLLVMGGDVLLALVEAAGARTLHILGEVSTGVVASELELAGRALRVMSKSGGFGDENLFLRLSEELALGEGESLAC